MKYKKYENYKEKLQEIYLYESTKYKRYKKLQEIHLYENTKKLQKIQKGEEGDIFEQKGWGVRYGAVRFGWCPV